VLIKIKRINKAEKEEAKRRSNPGRPVDPEDLFKRNTDANLGSEYLMD
jgi:hypothetical protein